VHSLEQSNLFLSSDAYAFVRFLVLCLARFQTDWMQIIAIKTAPVIRNSSVLSGSGIIMKGICGGGKTIRNTLMAAKNPHPNSIFLGICLRLRMPSGVSNRKGQQGKIKEKPIARTSMNPGSGAGVTCTILLKWLTPLRSLACHVDRSRLSTPGNAGWLPQPHIVAFGGSRPRCKADRRLPGGK
jgi:hypothetical protein